MAAIAKDQFDGGARLTANTDQDAGGLSAALRDVAADLAGVQPAAAAAATVGADIGAFTDPPSAAEMALLRTFVNALKADVAAIRTAMNAAAEGGYTLKTTAS